MRSHLNFNKSLSSVTNSDNSASSASPVRIYQKNNLPKNYSGGNVGGENTIDLQPCQPYQICSMPLVIMQAVKSTQIQKPAIQNEVIVLKSPSSESSTKKSDLPSCVSSVKNRIPEQMQCTPLLPVSHASKQSRNNTSAQHAMPPSSHQINFGLTAAAADAMKKIKSQQKEQQQRPQPSSPSQFTANTKESIIIGSNLDLKQDANNNSSNSSNTSLLSRKKDKFFKISSNRSITSKCPQYTEISDKKDLNYKKIKQPSIPEVTNNNVISSSKIKPDLLKSTSQLTNKDDKLNRSNNNDSQICSAASAATTESSNKVDLKFKKIKHHSPIPERKIISKEKEEERKEFRIKHYSPKAFKFFMEQHIENVLKSYKQRTFRKNQLEKEMNKIGLSSQAQMQMRKMLNQKESNYIRLKRARMDKSMFVQLKHIGVGAFGEVSLVRKIDTTNHLYAMKTLRKGDVLKRNQMAHVKAERDILAEADNEWVVKLYYSFQDRDNLYFVMDYIPGGDLMSLLIKQGVFEEPLAKFYIAELTCAVESVHKMGFIHRDIKPDNILIDRDGHIKLTDFGLCTGFRWTHNSKYYQEHGDHNRQDSMEQCEDLGESGRKPLERRHLRDHQRVQAHSLVGTPNYIAPEVLERSGYTQLCDWWSVGVILYEMLVGQPPFLANTAIETQHKVINWEKTFSIPAQANLTNEAANLICRLCTSSDNRLGKNADEVKQHEFFQGIDFNDMRKQKALYVPKIEHPTDTSNFDPIDSDKLLSSIDSNGDINEDAEKLFHGFFEFTFRRFFDDRLDKLSPDMCDDNGPVYV